jgi:hypothetical protein
MRRMSHLYTVAVVLAMSVFAGLGQAQSWSVGDLTPTAINRLDTWSRTQVTLTPPKSDTSR